MTSNEKIFYNPYKVSPTEMYSKSLMKDINDGYHDLARAVILKAVQDYKEALVSRVSRKNVLSKKKSSRGRKRVEPEAPTPQETIDEIEAFFSSKWFTMLTGQNGNMYIKELKDGNYKCRGLYA